MCKILFLSGLLLLFVSCREEPEQVTVVEGVVFEPPPEITDRDYGLYGVESGVVIRLFGKDSSREEIYFDRWGCRQARYEYIRFEGETKTTLWGATIDDTSVTHYLSLGNTYFSAENRRMLHTVNADSMGFEEERALAEKGYMCTGTKEVAGRLCKVWEYAFLKDTSRSYFYKGILLKETEYKRGKHRSKEISVTFKENEKIPEEKFTIPGNYTYKDALSPSNAAFERLLGR